MINVSGTLTVNGGTFVQNGATLTLGALTMTTGTYTVGASSLSVTGAASFAVSTNFSAATGLGFGAVSVSAGTVTLGSQTLTIASVNVTGGSFDAGSSTLTVTGTVATNGGTFSANASTAGVGGLDVNTGVFSVGTSRFTVNGDAAFSVNTDVSGATSFRVTGTLTSDSNNKIVTIGTARLGSLNLQGGDMSTTASSVLTIDNTLSMPSGTPTFTMGNGATLTVGGAMNKVKGLFTPNAGGCTLSFGSFSATGGTWGTGGTGSFTTGAFTLDGGGAMDMSGFTTAFAINGALVVNANTLTLANTHSISPTSVTVSGGVLKPQGATIHVVGGAAPDLLVSGGTLNTTGGSVLNVEGKMDVTSGTFTGGTTVSLTVHGNLTTGLNMNLSSATLVSVGGTLKTTAGTIQFQDGKTISLGAIDVQGGTLQSNSATLNVTGSATIGSGALDLTKGNTGSGTLTTGADLTASGGTVKFVTAAVTVNSLNLQAGATFSSTATQPSGSMSVTTTTQIATTTDLSHLTGLTFGGSVSITAGAVTLGAVAVSPPAVTVTGGTLTAGAGNITVSGATAVGSNGGTISLAGGTTSLATLSITSGGTFSSSTGTGTMTLSGALTMTGGAFSGSTGTSTFNGTASISGTTALAGSTFNAGSGTVTFNGPVTVGGSNLLAAFHAQSATVNFKAITGAMVPDSLLIQGTAATPFDAAAGAHLTFGTNAAAGTNAINLATGIMDLSLVTGGVTISAGNVYVAASTTFKAAAVGTTFPATVSIYGTVTGNTATMTFSGPVTIYNGGSFSGSSGGRTFSSTLTIQSTGSYVSSTGAHAFNTVGTAGTFTLTTAASTPTFSTSLTVSGGTTTFGTWTGTSVTIPSLSVSGGTFDCATNNTSLTVSTTTDVSGGTANLASTAAMSLKAVTVSAGSLTLGSGTAALTSTLDVTGGTFTAGSGPVTITGAVNVNNGGIVNAGSSSNFRGNSTLTLGTVGAGSLGTFNGQTAAITFTGATTVQSASTFDAGTAGTLTLAALTLGNATPTTGTFNASSKPTVTIGGAALVQAASTFNANSAGITFSSTLDLQGASAFNLGSATVTVSGVFSLLGSSTFSGGTGSATFSVAPTLTSGTFTVGTAGTAGIITMTGGATFASGASLVFPSDKGVLRLGNGTSLTVHGPVTSTWTTGSTRPLIDCNGCATGITVTFRSTSTLNISGMEFHDSVAAGVTIEQNATYTLLKNLTFASNKGGAGSTHLNITLGTAVKNVPGCIFDPSPATVATAATNVTLKGDSLAVRGAKLIFEFQSTGVNGVGAGESLDADGDSNDDNYGDALGSPYYGSVVEWVKASPSDTTGTLSGFPSAAFDWNTFSYYGVYASYNDVTGSPLGAGADRLWVRNVDGSAKYYWDNDPANGNIVGTPKWDTVAENGLDINGDSDTTDTGLHVVYIATANGHIIKLWDSGSALVRPPAPWNVDWTDSTNVASITSGLIADATNLYFGCTASDGSTWIRGLEIATNARTLARNVSTLSSVTATPSWKAYSGNTYLFVGSTASSGSVYMYRIDVNSGVQAFSTDAAATINDGVRLVNNRAFAVTEGGTLHVLDASDFGVGGFQHNVTGFPYQTTAASPIRFAPYIDTTGASTSSFTTAYFGDNAGNVYAVNSSGAALTGYPFALTGSAITSTPIYLRNSGVIAIGAADGTLYFIDRHNGSNAPAIFKRYTVSTTGSVSSVGYNNSTSQYMVGTSDGRLVFIAASDVTDPTSSIE
jgi:hypothetical protein